MEKLQEYLKDSKDEMLDLLYTLCGIPAPSGKEEKRAAFILDWLRRNGLTDAYIDEAQNVIWRYKDDGGSLAALAAHTDTVFPEETSFEVRMDGNRAYCPGIGDDTVNVAMLMMLMRYLHRNQPKTQCGMLFTLNSCEEAAGDHKGVKKLFAEYGSRIRQFVSVDGVMGLLCVDVIGYALYRISIRAKGGHAFGDFGAPNAIEQMSRLVARLYAEPLPDVPGAAMTYNVGTFTGGSSGNAIAQEAQITYECRSDSRKGFQLLKERLLRITDEFRTECLELTVVQEKESPWGRVDSEEQKKLTERCVEAIYQTTGQRPQFCPGSSDCNIPVYMGIPAVLFGTRYGAGAHSYDECLDMDKVHLSYEAVARLIASYMI